MDNATLYLILALSAFVFIVVLMIHQHNCADEVSRRKHAVDSLARKLDPRIEQLETEIADLKVKIEAVDEEIVTFQ